MVNTIADIENLIGTKKDEAKSIKERLNLIDIEAINNREPSEFAIKFINFIKLCNSSSGGEENTSPPFHYEMLDRAFVPDEYKKRRRVLNVVFRGSGKTTIFVEYLILYLSIFRCHYTTLPYSPLHNKFIISSKSFLENKTLLLTSVSIKSSTPVLFLILYSISLIKASNITFFM